MSNKKGFTLVELVMVIVLLGILAVIAIPKFFDLATEAKQSAEKGVVGGVRAAIHTYFAKYQVFPSALDSVPVSTDCSTANPCFINVLAQGGVTSDWSKGTSVDSYIGPASTTYIYYSTTGEFKE